MEIQRRTERERRPVKKWEPIMEPRATALLRPSELKLRFKRDEEKIRTAPSSLPPPSERRVENRKRVVEEMIAVATTTREEARVGITNKRIRREDRFVQPPLSSEDKRRIKEVAHRVVRDDDGHLTEKLLLRLLSMTRNSARWGFLSPDHPVHPYYLQRKVIERCRMHRTQLAAAGDLSLTRPPS